MYISYITEQSHIVSKQMKTSIAVAFPTKFSNIVDSNLTFIPVHKQHTMTPNCFSIYCPLLFGKKKIQTTGQTEVLQIDNKSHRNLFLQCKTLLRKCSTNIKSPLANKVTNTKTKNAVDTIFLSSCHICKGKNHTYTVTNMQNNTIQTILCILHTQVNSSTLRQDHSMLKLYHFPYATIRWRMGNGSDKIFVFWNLDHPRRFHTLLSLHAPLTND